MNRWHSISHYFVPLLELNTIHLPGLLHVSKVYIWGLLGTLPYPDPSECHKPHYEVLYCHEFEIQDGRVHKLLPWNSNLGSKREKHFKVEWTKVYIFWCFIQRAKLNLKFNQYVLIINSKSSESFWHFQRDLERWVLNIQNELVLLLPRYFNL